MQDLASEITTKSSELLELLAALQSPTAAPNASAQEREAARYLYERIIDYRGLLHRRPLTRRVEYLIASLRSDALCTTSGWHYKCQSGSNRWIGPFATHKAAAEAATANATAAKLASLMARYAAATEKAA